MTWHLFTLFVAFFLLRFLFFLIGSFLKSQNDRKLSKKDETLGKKRTVLQRIEGVFTHSAYFMKSVRARIEVTLGDLDEIVDDLGVFKKVLEKSYLRADISKRKRNELLHEVEIIEEVFLYYQIVFQNLQSVPPKTAHLIEREARAVLEAYGVVFRGLNAEYRKYLKEGLGTVPLLKIVFVVYHPIESWNTKRRNGLLLDLKRKYLSKELTNAKGSWNSLGRRFSKLLRSVPREGSFFKVVLLSSKKSRGWRKRELINNALQRRHRRVAYSKDR